MRKNEGVVSKEHFNESRKIKKLCATALSKSERLARTTDLLGSEGRFVHKHKMEFFFENFLNTEVLVQQILLSAYWTTDTTHNNNEQYHLC